MAEDTFTITTDTEQAQEQINKIVESLKQGVQYATSLSAELKNIGNFKAPIPVGGGAPTRGRDQTGDSTYRELATRHMRDEIKYFKTFTEYNKLFKPFSAEVATLTRGMIGIGSNLLKLVAGGALGGAAGFLGAVMPLARNAVEDRKVALQLGGANIGKMKAAGTAFGNILNVPSAVGNISAGQFDITSPAYTALKLMGLSDAEIQGSDPSDLLVRAMKIEQGRMKSYPNKQTAITMETARGATSIFGPEGLKALGALPTGEFEDRRKQYQDIQKSLDLTQKEQQAIDRLTRHVDAAGEEIQTVFVKNLATMAPYLTQFSDWIADFVVNRIPHEPGKLTEDIGKNTLKDFAIPIYKWIFGDEKEKGSADSWFKSITDGFNKEWEKLFGNPEDKWRPFFNNLENDWKNFFDKISQNLSLPEAIAGTSGAPLSIGPPNKPGSGPHDAPGRFAAPISGPSTTYTGPPGEGWENKWGSASGSRQLGSTEGWGLQPGFKEKIDKLLAAGAAAGFPASINEGFRSYAYQDFLWHKLYGHGPVARAGGSWHEKGFAVDLSTKGLDWYIKHAPEYGVYPGANFGDPGHFQDHPGVAANWPAYTPKWVSHGHPSVTGPAKSDAPVSMNDMRQFQRGDLGFRVHVNNPAGANVAVSSGMLGASLGNYGNA